MEIEIAAKGRKGGGGGGEGKGRGSGGLSEATLLFLAKNRHQRSLFSGKVEPKIHLELEDVIMTSQRCLAVATMLPTRVVYDLVLWPRFAWNACVSDDLEDKINLQNNSHTTTRAGTSKPPPSAARPEFNTHRLYSHVRLHSLLGRSTMPLAHAIFASHRVPGSVRLEWVNRMVQAVAMIDFVAVVGRVAELFA